MTYKLTTILLITLISYTVQAQFVPQATEENGLFLKASVGKGIGIGFHDLSFFTNSGAYADITVAPGAGYNFAFGTGIRSKFFDFELQLEESIMFAFIASYGSGGNVTFSCSMLKTHLFGIGYFKIPMKKNDNYLRIGGGPFLTFPARFNAKLDGTRLGHAKYDPSLGYSIDINLVIDAKSFYLVPGLRLKISELQSNEITFYDNLETLSNYDISSIDFYLAVQF